MEALTPHSASNDSLPLQMTLDRLTKRIEAFERELQEAIAAEHSFRENMLTVTNSLDSFVENHSQEDTHLTRLIQEDTQRSRDAKEEYEVLAARFDESFRPSRSGRHMELLRTVSLYISIVVSVVFMAPLHAILSILEKLLRRVGLGRREDSDANARYRARQNWRRAANAARFSSSLRQRHMQALAKERRKERGERSAAETSAAHEATPMSIGTKKSEISKEPKQAGSKLSFSRINDHATGSANALLQGDYVPAVESNHGIGDTAIRRKDQGSDGKHLQQLGESQLDSSDSEDEFVDAIADCRNNGTRESAEHERDDGSEETKERDEGSRSRPDWACPSESQQTLREMTFPSHEFWNISDDDIRMDFLRHRQPSSKQ